MAPPPSKRTPVVLIAAVTGGLGGTALSVVLTYSGKGNAALWSSAIAVIVCSVASWLLRAPADDEEDGGSDRLSGGGGPDQPRPGPDEPDPDAFDWDAFERAGRRTPTRPFEPVG